MSLTYRMLLQPLKGNMWWRKATRPSLTRHHHTAGVFFCVYLSPTEHDSDDSDTSGPLFKKALVNYIWHANIVDQVEAICKASPCSLLSLWDCLISSRLKSDDVKSRLASSSAIPWLHLWVNNWCRFWGYWKAVAAHLTKRSICFDLSLSHAIYFPSSLCGFDLAETAARFLYLFHAELQGSLWLWQTQSFKYSTQRNLAFIRMMFYPPALVHQSACVLASCYFLIASYCIDFLWLVGSWLQTRACSLPLVVPDYHNTAQVHQTAVQVFIF